jgi:hypothetical protein
VPKPPRTERRAADQLHRHAFGQLAAVSDRFAADRDVAHGTELVGHFERPRGRSAPFCRAESGTIPGRYCHPADSQFLTTSAWRENNRIRIEDSAAVVDAAMAAGVDRYPSQPRRRGQHPPRHRGRPGWQRLAFRLVLRAWGCPQRRDVRTSPPPVGLVIGRPDSYVSSIHLDDAAAVIAALDVAGGTDNEVDDEPLTKRAYADALAAALSS